jgi:copper chaperone CopZ
MTIERELKDLAGVREVKADLNSHAVTVAWEPPASWEQIAATLEEIGYPAA